MHNLRSLRISGLVLCCMVFGTIVRADPKPFEFNMDKVKVAGNSFGRSKTIFVPAVNLEITSQGSVWSQSKVGAANAQAHGKFFVKGLDKPFVQDLARKVQDDLVTKLRAAGYTVFTFNDLKGEADISGHGRDSIDDKWDLPARSRDGLTWVFVAPSDDQALARGMTASPIFWLKGLAKAKQLTVIQPEIKLSVPQMWGEKDEGYKRAGASVDINPVMLMEGAMVYGMDEKAGEPHIQIQRHGQRPAADVAGSIRKMSEDTTSFSSTWGRSSADYLFTLDATAFSDGVLRVGYALNDLIVATAKKSK